MLRVDGVLRWNSGSLIHLLVFYCDRVLVGSILNLVKVEGGISCKFPLTGSSAVSSGYEATI